MPIEVSVRPQSERITIAAAKKAMKASLDGMLARAAPHIKIEIGKLIAKKIKGSPEYAAMLTGRLYHELGVPDIAERLNNIIDTYWAGSVDIVVRKVRFNATGIRGGMRIKAVDSSWKDALTDADATFITSNIDASPLDWLDWMLNQGNKTVVKDFGFVFYSHPRSRTGTGLMAKSTKGRKRRWMIPTEHSGTARNNFVTRALQDIDKEAGEIIEREILKQVK